MLGFRAQPAFARTAPLSASLGNPSQMFALQKQRLGIVIRLTQENAMLLTLQQRVAGKEIEMLVAEQTAIRATDPQSAEADLFQAAREHAQMQELLDHHARAVADMETALKQVDADIAALCHS
jgi:hypothetical protein